MKSRVSAMVFPRKVKRIIKIWKGWLLFIQLCPSAHPPSTSYQSKSKMATWNVISKKLQQEINKQKKKKIFWIMESEKTYTYQMYFLRNESDLVIILLLNLSHMQRLVNFPLKTMKACRNCALIFWIYVIYITSAFSSRQWGLTCRHIFMAYFRACFIVPVYHFPRQYKLYVIQSIKLTSIYMVGQIGRWLILIWFTVMVEKL